MAELLAEELDYARIDRKLIQGAIEALDAAKEHGARVATAESCTGGLIATVLSEAPGAADYFAGGFVVYTPEQKCAALGLDPALVKERGSVSAEVTTALAEAALHRSKADIAVAVTGVAGPEPDEKGNPVGLVYLAGARKERTVSLERNFGDIGRANVRYETALAALSLIKALAEGRA